MVKSGKLDLVKQENYAMRHDFLIHDIESQIKYFYSLWKNNSDLIKLDEYLNSNFPT